MCLSRNFVLYFALEYNENGIGMGGGVVGDEVGVAVCRVYNLLGS